MHPVESGEWTNSRCPALDTVSLSSCLLRPDGSLARCVNHRRWCAIGSLYESRIQAFAFRGCGRGLDRAVWHRLGTNGRRPKSCCRYSTVRVPASACVWTPVWTGGLGAAIAARCGDGGSSRDMDSGVGHGVGTVSTECDNPTQLNGLRSPSAAMPVTWEAACFRSKIRQLAWLRRGHGVWWSVRPNNNLLIWRAPAHGPRTPSHIYRAHIFDLTAFTDLSHAPHRHVHASHHEHIRDPARCERMHQTRPSRRSHAIGCSTGRGQS